MDNDKVTLTNINRQSIAYHSTIGQYKTKLMKDRIWDISSEIEVITHEKFILPENLHEIFDRKVDYIIDCLLYTSVYSDWLEENRDVYKGRDNQEFKERIEEILERKIPTLTLNGLERAREMCIRDRQRISKRSDLSDIWNRCRDCCSVFDTIQGKSGAAIYCICSDGDCFGMGDRIYFGENIS